ncbi:MFS transporter [Parafrankia colletiae]|uniref:MFS transporter n=1 Tax=Parafrankia colletiae TaxID=573497 RepID=A0A1S1Q6H8_9ACTN|nr:MFS transporter [Parafrankia colletiae]
MAPAPPHARSALAAAMLGFFVVALDAQATNVALPDIHTDLGGGLSGLQWVVTGYTLMFSALLLFGGTLSDRIGARRAYGAGMLVFVAASVASCGLAPNLATLIVARLAQGVGAALITPTSLALIREAYLDSTQRARAIAFWAMGGAVAAAAGPILGGALTQLNWRWIFILNVPAAALALAVLSRTARTVRRGTTPFDPVGQVTAIIALGALTYAVIEGGGLGYTSPAILGSFVISAVALAVFFTAQRRGRHPMVPLALFRSRTVTTALSVAFLTMAAFYGVVFLQSLYFQQFRGAGALQTGLLFLPMTAMVALLNPAVAHVSARFGPLVPIVAGQLIMIGGLVALSLAPADAPLLLIAVLMVPVGVGGSFTVPPVTSLLMDSVDAHQAGTASGVLNTFRQLGGSLGVAAFGAIVATASSFPTGLHISLLSIAALLVLAVTATIPLARARHVSGLHP